MASALTFHCLLLCMFSCSFYSIAHGGDEHNFVIVPTSSLEPKATCSTPRVAPTSNRTSVLLTHRHGPCAPVQTKKKPSFAEMLRQDRLRTNYLLDRASERTSMQSDVSIPTDLGFAVDSLEYVITVGFGTPAVPQTVLIDTGSDLPWIQCTPCPMTKCYTQKNPFFDPTNSSTYAPVSCSSDTCKNLTSYYADRCKNNSQCGYQISYGDDSNTTGIYSNETLTLTSSDVINNFRFGCGHDQEGPNDKYDGLMGLGGSPESLVSQTSQVYGGVFSYCLPPTKSSTGFLTLGAPSNMSDFVFTPMSRLAKVPTFYVLTLTGINVGGQQLDIPASVFSSGSIIDSGTVITGLPATAYKALRSAFRSAMAMYPPAPPMDYLDTCYNFTGYSNMTVPRIALTFSGGATVDLDVPSGILLGGCLAFLGGSSDNVTGIIGNVQQRTFEVLYDAGRGTVGFRPSAC